ncbi:hypothetical protein [Tahibacter caeni]|uniref:hypothetical protein n=1 Tax=Tahibacter caeni TaxID=1453545 RepID=UPI002147F787|nr:hypothetical protein [Tahibacter caeni]
MRTNRMRAGKACLLASLLPLPFAVVQAQGLALPAGARLQLDGGRLEAAGGDVLVDGTLVLGAGELRGVGALRIAAGASADFGSGTATLTGDWENRGTFLAGSSRVELRDGPAAVSAVLGTNLFANLSLVSGSGKRYRLESGLTQAVGGNLQIQGLGPAIQVDVTAPGSVAYLNLLPGGSQTIANVGVSDVHATGQHLAPTQTNQGGSGNDSGWFGGGVVIPRTPVPALSPGLQLLLAMGLVLIAMRRRGLAAVSRG